MGYEYGTQVNRALTGGMMLWAVAIIFVFLTVLSVVPLLFVHESKALRTVGNRMFFLIMERIGTTITVTAWTFSIYGWSIAHRAFEVSNVEVHMGSALWMGLTAAILMIILFFIGWPPEAWDGPSTRANNGAGARGVPIPPGVPANGYYHYKRTTREVVPRY